MLVLALVHTNDLHGRIDAPFVQFLRRLRVLLPVPSLLLDAGDAVASGNVTFRVRGEDAHDRMVDAGYDVAIVGNREFHFSEAGFRAKLSRASFPVLCANLRPTRPGSALPVSSSVSFEAAGLSIGVLGLTVPMITERMLARRVSGFVFDDPIATARRLAPPLRASCDLLVALTHIGMERDQALAAAVPGIDLIVGGHTHALLPEGQRVGSTLIVQAGSHGRAGGVVEVHRDDGRLALTARLVLP
ncbi:MAG TPA: metallophosphoesterase [Chthonomonadales bacterium]|nr:metallophosphoesterase [Chthonomonadales bacterium]